MALGLACGKSRAPGPVTCSSHKKCVVQIEDDGNILEMDGRGAAQEIARSLEKGGIIKVKGESIKWKR